MSKFKVGDVVRTDDTMIRNSALDNGFLPEEMVVTWLDGRGYPILAWEKAGSFGWDPDLLELATQTASKPEQFIVSYTPFVYDTLEEAEADALKRFSDGDAVVISRVVRHAVITLTLQDQQ